VKTEAMWISSLQNCENEPLGEKWKTCVKFLGISLYMMNRYQWRKILSKG